MPSQKGAGGRCPTAQVREHLEPRHGFDEGDTQGGKPPVLDFSATKSFTNLIADSDSTRKAEIAH